MELADLTRVVRKKKKTCFQSLKNCFFCKAGLVNEFQKGSAGKNIFSGCEKLFFFALPTRRVHSISSVRGNAEKTFQSLEKLFLSFTREVPLSFYQAIGVKQCFRFPNISTLILSGFSQQSKHVRKINLSEPEKLFFCKARFHPIRP